MTIKQVKTHSVTITWTMKRASFGRGFREAQTGKPFDYDAYPDNPKEQWHYERGRLLGSIYSGKLKNGHDIIPDAYRVYLQARDEGLIL